MYTSYVMNIDCNIFALSGVALLGLNPLTPDLKFDGLSCFVHMNFRVKGILKENSDQNHPCQTTLGQLLFVVRLEAWDLKANVINVG